MKQIVGFLADFCEAIVLLSVLEKSNKEMPYRIRELNPKEINESCPIKYRVEIDPDEFFKGIGE